ncbi:IclR family transcriptional regulator C-terminal domain-containing protein [Streptomyces sp. PSRA5]|uniref:IclR family transcriptional regulator domain-containing protein n=1 Tax=Streptomyces panacea TaxID=3035064 RepID=UPI00339C21DD
MGRLDAAHAEARQQRKLAGANPADFSEALGRGLAVLAAFGAERRRLTQADLARELGLPRATVRRVVVTLEHLGYLLADGRSYTLSPRILRLAEGYLRSNVISTIVQPTCDRICDELTVSCSVAVLDGPDAVMIARAVPQRLLPVGSGVGFRVPARRSSLGKVLLAHPDTPDEDRTGHDNATAADGAVDDEVLREIRDTGYCYVVNDVEVGFHSIAVPIRRWDGRVIAALNAGSALEQLSAEEMRGRVLEALRRNAEELRSQLL